MARRVHTKSRAKMIFTPVQSWEASWPIHHLKIHNWVHLIQFLITLQWQLFFLSFIFISPPLLLPLFLLPFLSLFLGCLCFVWDRVSVCSEVGLELKICLNSLTSSGLYLSFGKTFKLYQELWDPEEKSNAINLEFSSWGERNPGECSIEKSLNIAYLSSHCFSKLIQGIKPL